MRARMIAAVAGTALTLAGLSPAAGAVPSRPDFRVTLDQGVVIADRGAGDSVPIFGMIKNLGPTSAATFTVTFPRGLTLGSTGITDDGFPSTRLPCRRVTSATWSCTLTAGWLDQSGGFAFSVRAPMSTRPGPTPGVHLRVDPIGQPNTVPAHNTATAPVQVFGRAHLRFSVSIPADHLRTTTSAAIRIRRGVATRLVFTITNLGPDPAPAASFNYGMLPRPAPDFTLTYPNGRAIVTPQGWVSAAVGTLAPGHSASRVLVLTGHRATAKRTLGTNGGIEYWYDPASQCADRACIWAAQIVVTVS